jgi:DNA-directed RNA polymerase subunit RPC12/RpoP
MRFPFNCLDCGHVNHAVWSQVGQQTECDRCGKSVTVPAPMETISEPQSEPPPQRLKFRCPSCRRKFSTKADMAGQKIRCTGCGAGVRVPWAEEASEMPSSQPAVAVFAKSDEIAIASEPRRVDPVRPDVPRLDVARAVARSASAPAPSLMTPELDAIASLDGSGRRRRAESVLSPRSSMLELARQQAAEEEAAETQRAVAKDPKKKKKKKKKNSSFFDPKETLKLVAGVGVLVAVLAFLAWGYPDFRLPLGGFLCVVGFIVYVMGAVSLRQLVAEEGMFKLILFRICPPYQWWFIFTRWQETRDFFAFFLAGAMVMSIGGAIIKISPLSMKAEAAERAYQKKQAELLPPMPGGIVEADDDD